MASRLKDSELSKRYRVDNNGCWIWLGTITPMGYGTFKRSKKTYRAHRYMYEFYKAPIPPNLELDHICRVKCCVNPDHLEPVSHKTNMVRGSNTKVTPQQMKEIIVKSFLGKSTKELTIEYGIDRSTICDIKYGRRTI